MHIAISVGAVPEPDKATDLANTVRAVLIRYTSPEVASYAAERIAKGVEMDMEVFSGERVPSLLQDLHGVGLRAVVTSEQ